MRLLVPLVLCLLASQSSRAADLQVVGNAGASLWLPYASDVFESETYVAPGLWSELGVHASVRRNYRLGASVVYTTIPASRGDEPRARAENVFNAVGLKVGWRYHLVTEGWAQPFLGGAVGMAVTDKRWGACYFGECSSYGPYVLPILALGGGVDLYPWPSGRLFLRPMLALQTGLIVTPTLGVGWTVGRRDAVAQ